MREMIRVDPKRVRRFRENQGITRREVARRADISTSYACMIERGDRTSLSASVAYGIAEALGVDVDEIRRTYPRLRLPR